MVTIGAVSTLDFTLQPGDGTVASGEHPVVAIQAMFYKGSDSSKVAKSLLFNKADAVDATTTYNAAGLVRVPFTGVSAIVLESLGNGAQLRLGKRDSKTIISIMSCKVGGAWPASWEVFQSCLTLAGLKTAQATVKKLRAYYHLVGEQP